VAVVTGCGLLVSIIPILRVLKFDVDATLRAENAKGVTSHLRVRTYEPLLALQIALTLALTIGSGLMVKSVIRLFAVPVGFDSENVVTTTLSLPSAKHAWKYNAVFSERVVEHLRALPGIEAVGVIRGLPMNESRFENRFQRWDRPEEDGPLVRIRVVSGGYFQAIGIPIVAGRDFTPIDGTGEIGVTKVIIINEAMAQLLWPGINALGQKVTTGEPKQVIEVVGVVGNARYASIDAPPVPEVYYPVGVFPQDQMALVVRTTGDPLAISAALHTAITEIERDVFITPFQTVDQLLLSSVSGRRFLMALLNVFTAMAVFLAVAGIAGIVAYALSLRIREIGIRVAIGAAPSDIILLVSRHALLPTVVGLAPGVLLAFGLTQQLSHMLYGVSPYDPLVFLSAVCGLSVVSMLVAGLTAYRASRIDPAGILR
jgi:predicted permease